VVKLDLLEPKLFYLLFRKQIEQIALGDPDGLPIVHLELLRTASKADYFLHVYLSRPGDHCHYGLQLSGVSF
jgi:hypothetical protein